VHKSVKSDVRFAIIGLDFEVSESTGILSLSRLCQRLQPVGKLHTEILLRGIRGKTN
jgi:hypothetical protein